MAKGMKIKAAVSSAISKAKGKVVYKSKAKLNTHIHTDVNGNARKKKW